jgi:hypothetical protein
MAVVSMMRIPGDADDLASRFREHLAEVGERHAPKHGGLGSIIARTDDGLLVINLWETEQGRHAMADEPEIQEALKQAGFPPPAFEGFEVIEYRIRPEAVRS